MFPRMFPTNLPSRIEAGVTSVRADNAPAHPYPRLLPLVGKTSFLLILSILTSCSPTLGSMGAVLAKNNDTGQVTVRDAPPDMAAATAGIRPGDTILLIDGRDVRPMTPEQVHEQLIGPVGTTVAVTVEREGRIVRLQVRRGPLRKSATSTP